MTAKGFSGRFFDFFFLFIKISKKMLDKGDKIWYNTDLIRADARLSAMQIFASMVE